MSCYKIHLNKLHQKLHTLSGALIAAMLLLLMFSAQPAQAGFTMSKWLIFPSVQPVNFNFDGQYNPAEWGSAAMFTLGTAELPEIEIYGQSYGDTLYLALHVNDNCLVGDDMLTICINPNNSSETDSVNVLLRYDIFPYFPRTIFSTCSVKCDTDSCEWTVLNSPQAFIESKVYTNIYWETEIVIDCNNDSLNINTRYFSIYLQITDSDDAGDRKRYGWPESPDISAMSAAYDVPPLDQWGNCHIMTPWTFPILPVIDLKYGECAEKW